MLVPTENFLNDQYVIQLITEYGYGKILVCGMLFLLSENRLIRILLLETSQSIYLGMFVEKHGKKTQLKQK